MNLEDLVVYDNEGITADRYTVLAYPASGIHKGYWESLGLSMSPGHPQGFSQWSLALPGDHLGTIIKFSDLPKNVQEHVKRRLE